MADYYPLIARAVSGLDKSTGEARRALYERARTALVTQLRGVVPALSEADITRERLALEEAIRKVEADAARRPRMEAPRAESTPSPRQVSPPPQRAAKPAVTEPVPSPEKKPDQAPPRDTARVEAPKPEQAAAEPSSPTLFSAPEEPSFPSEPMFPPEPSFPPEQVMPGRRADKRVPGDRPSLMDQGLKGFREVMAETDDLGEAAASASKSARDLFAAFPPTSRASERIPPQHEPQDLLSMPRELPSPAPRESFQGGAKQPPSGPTQLPPYPDDFDEPPRPRRLGAGLGGMARILAFGGILIVLGIVAAFAYREWPRVAELYQSLRGPATQAAKDPAQTRAKIADRIGATGQQDSSARPGAAPTAAVAQRVLLYEQQPNTQDRKQFVGSVIWRAETGSPGPGLPPDVAIKADVEIPERQMRVSFTLRRNADQSLPASHTIEVLLSTPPDFPLGSIADVPGVLMEQGEQSRGAPLAGLRVKVTNGFFLIGLSSVESDVRRNIMLLKERSWLHIPILYEKGSRALLAMEKGVPGDRVFDEAFAAWQQ